MFISWFLDFLDGFFEFDEDIVYGYKFKWILIYLSEVDIFYFFYFYDEFVIIVFDRFDEIVLLEMKGWRCLYVEGFGQRDLYVLLQKYVVEDLVLEKLWEEVMVVLDWVDWEQIV